MAMTPIKEKNINFYYEFDYDKLRITDEKKTKFEKSFKIYKSNFENNYFDYMSPYDNNDPSNFSNLVNKMNELQTEIKKKSPSFISSQPNPQSSQQEPSQTLSKNDFKVRFGISSKPIADNIITLNAYVGNSSSQESEEKRYLEHFRKEMEYLEQRILNRTVEDVNIYFLKLDENNFSFDNEKLQKEYKKTKTLYITKSIEKYVSDRNKEGQGRRNFQAPRSYTHPEELKLTYGNRLKNIAQDYKSSLFKDIPKEEENLFWILCYNLQEYHKQFNLYEKPLTEVQDFSVTFNRFKIEYTIDNSSSLNHQEYFKKDENFISKNGLYKVGDTEQNVRYKIVKEILKEPYVFACFKYEKNNHGKFDKKNEKFTMTLNPLFTPTKDEIMYEAIIKNDDMKKISSGKLYRTSFNESEGSNNKATLQLFNIIPETTLIKDIFFYNEKFLFNKYDLIKFKESVNSKQILEEIQNKDNFDLYVLTNREYFSKFVQYCLNKLKKKLQPDKSKKNKIIETTISILLKKNRPFGQRNSSGDIKQEKKITYVIDRIDWTDFEIKNTENPIIVEGLKIHLKERPKSILSNKIGKTCEERTNILSNILNKTKKILFSGYYSAVIGGKTRKKRKKRRRSLNRRKRN